MKRIGLGLVCVVVAAMSVGTVGCAPGLSHRAAAPATEATPGSAMMDESELHALIGETTVTSGEAMPMPESRMPVSESPSSMTPSTWSANEQAAEGTKAKSSALPEFDMHPYDNTVVAAPPAGAPTMTNEHPYD